MFRRGRGGCYEREGRRPWCLLGHARVARMLLVYAVANFTRPSTCTATDFVITPRGCGLVHGHHHGQLPSISHHSFCSPRSCLRPSRAVAAPELPVLEVAGQHRICMSVTPIGSPGEREDARTDASTLVNSRTEQRVKHCGVYVVLPAQYSANGHSATTLRSTSLPQNIGHRCRCRCAYAAGTHQLPLIARDVARVSAVDSPRLKRPPLALDTRDTGGWCYITSPSTYDASCTSTRRESGRTGEPVQPASCHRHSARGGSLPCRGAGHDESERPATDLDVACKITCTSHCTTMTAASSCRSSYFAPKNEPLLRLAALVTAVAEVWRGYLPPQVSILGQPGQFFDVALHTLFCTGCRQWLGSWAPTTTSKYSRLGALHTTPRPGYGGFTALHKRTTATPKHGSTSGSPHCCCRITSG